MPLASLARPLILTNLLAVDVVSVANGMAVVALPGVGGELHAGPVGVQLLVVQRAGVTGQDDSRAAGPQHLGEGPVLVVVTHFDGVLPA